MCGEVSQSTQFIMLSNGNLQVTGPKDMKVVGSCLAEMFKHDFMERILIKNNSGVAGDYLLKLP